MITSLNSASFDPRVREVERAAQIMPGQPGVQHAGQTTVDTAADTVTMRTPHLLTDAEAAEAMASVRQGTQEHATEALGLYQGLSHDRVMALLEGL